MLIECVWRMLRWQSQYKTLRDHFPVLLEKGADGRRRKRAVVGIARRLAIDLWRLATGQTTAAALRLEVSPSSSEKTR